MSGDQVKRFLILVFVGVSLLMMCGCCNDNRSSVQSTRTITLYANDGSVIKTWTPDDGWSSFSGGWAYFRVNGKKVKVTGTMISEDKGYRRYQ